MADNLICTFEKSNLISEQLRKFTNGFSHHLAGHYSNIDFWLDEVVDAIKTIDTHQERFKNLSAAQADWVKEHHTVTHSYCNICKGRCEFCDGKPSLPKNKYKTELSEAKRDLIDTAYYFLLRCYKIGLIDVKILKEKCLIIGSSVDLQDLS